MWNGKVSHTNALTIWLSSGIAVPEFGRMAFGMPECKEFDHLRSFLHKMVSTILRSKKGIPFLPPPSPLNHCT